MYALSLLIILGAFIIIILVIDMPSEISSSYNINYYSYILLLIGFLLLTTSVLSCIAVCSRSGKYKCLKMLLGLLYTLIGMGSLSFGILQTNMNQFSCGNFQYLTDLNIAALQFRKMYHNQTIQESKTKAVSNTDYNHDYAQLSLNDLNVDGKYIYEHPKFTKFYSKFNSKMLIAFEHFEQRFSCTGFCMVENVDTSIKKIFNHSDVIPIPEQYYVDTLTLWENNGSTVILANNPNQGGLDENIKIKYDVYTSNAFVKNIFGYNDTKDIYVIDNVNVDCAERIKRELEPALGYMAYLLGFVGFTFLISGVSCFCYMKRKVKYDSS